MTFDFYGGKGGVGKTTCAAAAASALAREGRTVLAISTDPAHSLGDALETKLGPKPRKVAKGLDALELDADRALDRWIDERRRLLATIAERGTYLDREDIERFLDLSFPGVDELVGLIEIRRIAGGGDWQHVVVDTAPTGHTLRLLEMPETLGRIARVFDDMEEKHRVLASTLAGRWRPDAADALIEELETESEELRALLRDRSRSRFHWVMLPEALSREETKDALAALDAAKIPVVEVIVNRLTPPPPEPCALCDGRRRAERFEVRAIRNELGPRGLTFLPALEEPPGGAALEGISRAMAAPDRGASLLAAKACKVPGGKHGRAEGGRFPLEVPAGLSLLFFGGKGGVGKTTCAAVTAIEAARRAPTRRVLLLSTDPAHSLADALEAPVGDDEKTIPGAPPNLRVRELDAPAEFARQRDAYRESVDRLFDRLRGRSRFDPAYDRAVVRDLIDLAPPGLDELFAILSVIETLFEKKTHDLVIVDTAPTGHALRLLRMPADAHRWVKELLKVLLKYREVIPPGELGADLVALSKGLRRLQEALADPAQARFVAVARPETLPIAETKRLAAALGGLGIALHALVINDVTPPGCARCRRIAARERARLPALERLCRGKCAIFLAPAIAPPPRGPARLAEWGARWTPA